MSTDSDRIRELELQCALQQQKLEAMEQKFSNLSGGINRGLWIIGGGFLASIVTWIARGGLNGGL